MGRISCTVIVCFGLFHFAFADDFKTNSGPEYKNVTVRRVEPDGIVVTSKSGVSKIYFTELPEEVQRRFHYSADEAATYSAEQNQRLAELGQQRKAEEQKRAKEREKYWSEHAKPAAQSTSSTDGTAERRGGTQNQQATSTVLSGGRIGPGSLPLLTLQQFEADQFTMIGRIIGIQFNFRETYTRRIDADWFSGEIRRYDPLTTTQDHFESANVLIPANALSWFQALPSGLSGARETVVYVQVEENRHGGTILRLLGTQIRRDMAGNGQISW